MKGSLRNASQLFICRCCKADSPITDGLNTDLHLDIGNGVSLEKVDKFSYLGDMLDVDGGCDSAVTTRVRSAWKKFHEYLPILTGKGFSLKLKGNVYATCVRSCLIILISVQFIFNSCSTFIGQVSLPCIRQSLHK